jgi:hypothetical protein
MINEFKIICIKTCNSYHGLRVGYDETINKGEIFTIDYISYNITPISVMIGNKLYDKVNFMLLDEYRNEIINELLYYKTNLN